MDIHCLFLKERAVCNETFKSIRCNYQHPCFCSIVLPSDKRLLGGPFGSNPDLFPSSCRLSNRWGRPLGRFRLNIKKYFSTIFERGETLLLSAMTSVLPTPFHKKPTINDI